jgi:hypothetical protein
LGVTFCVVELSGHPWGPDWPVRNDDLWPYTRLRQAQTLIERREIWNIPVDLAMGWCRANWRATSEHFRGTRITRRAAAPPNSFTLVTDQNVVLAIVDELRPVSIGPLLRAATVDGRRYHTKPEQPFASDVVELVDDADGSVDLAVIGRHYQGYDNSEVIANEHTYRFPVLGTSPRDSVMTATDESGCGIMRFRLVKPDGSAVWTPPLLLTRSAARIEIVVNPKVDITAELIRVAAIASGFLLTWHLGGGFHFNNRRYGELPPI